MFAVKATAMSETIKGAPAPDVGQGRSADPARHGPSLPRGPADAYFITGMLLLSFVVATVSLVTQPTALATAAWWPNAGIALGLAIRYPRRHVWALALAVAAVTAPAALWAGRPAQLAIALSLAVAVEVIIGTLLLRGRADRTPPLTSPSDLGRFILIVTLIAALYGLMAFSISMVLGDTTGAWERLFTSAPKHAAGMVLITPLFMALPRQQQRARPLETVLQVATAVTVAGYVFVLNDHLPLAFLPFVPLIWVALRMPTRGLVLLMLAVAVIASVGSAHGEGPFSFDRLGSQTGTVVLQVFQVSMTAVFLALSLVVGHERQTAARLYESEELFRKSFNSSVAGKLLVDRNGDRWTVRRSNPSAREILTGLGSGVTDLDRLLGTENVTALSEVVDFPAGSNTHLTLALPSGRSINLSIAAISEDAGRAVFALHFHDVTEALRVRELEQQELNQAAEVQRALLPADPPTHPGWQFGAASTPARQVGGDFYDLRVRRRHLALSLGDVMGKGMGAGMLAAAARTALRAHDPELNPAAVVTDTARILRDDLQRTNSFVTLAQVLVDLESGDFRLADAGHGLYFVLRAGTAAVERTPSGDLPLGVGERWEETLGTLAPGDTMVLVSDGVLDSWNGSLDALTTALVRAADRCDGDPKALVDALCTRSDEDTDHDDISAVALLRVPTSFAT